nr:hypothetical protein [Tanacetum cinerariifolium]
MGLDECYMSARSSLLTRDPLPEVKDAYVIVSREESHRGIPESSSIIETKLNATSFAAKSLNNFKRSNNNTSYTRSNNIGNGNRGPNPNLPCKNCGMIGHTIKRCYELIGYPPGFKKVNNLIKQTGFKQNFNANSHVKTNDKQQYAGSQNSSSSFTPEHMKKLLSLINETSSESVLANMAGRTITLGWIIDSEANQHLTVSTVGMSNIVDISNLKITVGHPNGTLATIILGTGSESCGLYLFDLQSDKNISNVNMIHAFNVSKSPWHSRLDHPADQVLVVLKDELKLNTDVSACEVCHRAKQTREPFPLSDHKFKKVGDLIHLDFKKAYKLFSLDNKNVVFSRDVKFYEAVFPFKMRNININEKADAYYASDADHLTFFDNQLTQSPYDEERATSVMEGSPSFSETDTDFTQSSENGKATKFEDSSLFKGSLSEKNYGSLSVPTHNLTTNPIDSVQFEPRRSSRVSKLPAKLNDYVVDSKLKYGLEKHGSYVKLNIVNYCYATTLNKSVEPTSYYEAAKDPKWIEVMNEEIDALYRNYTWTIVDLQKEEMLLEINGYIRLNIKHQVK